MQRTPIRSVSVVVALLAMLVVSVTVSAQTPPIPTEAGVVRWLTYVDPRFDFSIKYPSSWRVIPRDDSNPNAVSGILVLVPIDAPDSAADADLHDPGPHVIVVPYLAELQDGQSLSEWTEMYESLGHASDRAAIQRQPRRVFRVNGAKAVHEEGVSPLTTYQFTNIAHKNMVWDVWTNIPSTDPLAPIYDRIVRSFRFGRSSPKNLRDAYGSGFLPMDMEEALRLSAQGDEIEPSSVAAGHSRPSQTQAYVQLTSAWKSPVLNASYGPRTVRCGSPKHTNTSDNAYSKYAADISAGSLTNVYASMAGTVTFAGMKNNGFGNLVTIKASDGKEAYYAHLHTIFTQTGYSVPTLSFIAWSGNSTYPSDPDFPYHLHFHVRLGSESVDLLGMSGFSTAIYPGKWPGSPGTYEDCATMGRPN